MTPTSQLVRNAELLTDIFGDWPSFHDAEITSIRLERDGGDQREGPNLCITFHLFKGRPDPSRRSGVTWYDHTLATLEFSFVSELKLEGFNHQNVVFDLNISDLKPPGGRGPHVPELRVMIESSFGLRAEFRCFRIAVSAVERGLPPRSVYSE